GEEFDVSDAFSQLVERREATLDDRAAVLCRLDASRAPIEQTDAERMLEAGNCPRNRGLGGCQALRRLVHAAGLNDRHEDAHVVQLEAAFDALDLVHGVPLISELILPDRTIALTGGRKA